MQIQLTQDLYWDTEASRQSDEVTQYITDTVKPNLSVPTRDEKGRPYERTYETDTAIIRERQVYINDKNWARDHVEYIVTAK
jgi:hypothetical protein